MYLFKFQQVNWNPDGAEGDLCLRDGRMVLRITDGVRFRDIPRDYFLESGEWDDIGQSILAGAECSGERRRILERIRNSMEADLRRVRTVYEDFRTSGRTFSVDDVVLEFEGVSGFYETSADKHYKWGIPDIGVDHTESSPSINLGRYAASLGDQLESYGRYRTARAYRSASRSLVCYNGGHDLMLSDLTACLVRSYERYLLDRGLGMNTVSFYMRNLRAIRNRAIADGIIVSSGDNPFADVFTGVYQTRRRALSQGDMNTLASVGRRLERENTGVKRGEQTDGSGVGKKLSGRDLVELRDALQYFMFAYHSRGMSFIDLAYLKKSDIRDGIIIYKRRKTGFYLEVKVTGPMRKIVDYFRSRTAGSEYVFPLLKAGGGDLRRQYETALNVQNRRLKVLAGIAAIGNVLSTHVARHTWATFAKRLGYGTAMISEGLGHRDTKVTSIYLASFERSAMDELSTRLSRVVRAA